MCKHNERESTATEGSHHIQSPAGAYHANTLNFFGRIEKALRKSRDLVALTFCSTDGDRHRNPDENVRNSLPNLLEGQAQNIVERSLRLRLLFEYPLVKSRFIKSRLGFGPARQF